MNIDPSLRAEQRKFGLVMAAAFAALGFIRWGWHWHRLGEMPGLPYYFLGIAAAFLVLGLLCPAVLKPVLAGWMKLALGINWVVTHLILSLVFFLLFTPIAVVRRVMGLDLRKRDSKQVTFWVDAEHQPEDFNSYFNQF